MQDVRLAYIVKQSMDNGQSGKARWPVQHHLLALPFTTGDGDPHASTLPLLQQSLTTPPKLAGHATATAPATNYIRLQQWWTTMTSMPNDITHIT
jgi:hypothetical protein